SFRRARSCRASRFSHFLCSCSAAFSAACRSSAHRSSWAASRVSVLLSPRTAMAIPSSPAAMRPTPVTSAVLGSAISPTATPRSSWRASPSICLLSPRPAMASPSSPAAMTPTPFTSAVLASPISTTARPSTAAMPKTTFLGSRCTLLSTRSTAVRLPPVANLSPEHRRRCLIDTTLGIRLVTICYDTRSDSVPSQPFQVGVVTEPLLKHPPGLFHLALVTDRVIDQRFDPRTHPFGLGVKTRLPEDPLETRGKDGRNPGGHRLQRCPPEGFQQVRGGVVHVHVDSVQE